MNGFDCQRPNVTSAVPTDLLPHKYRPTSIDQVSACHSKQAQILKQWVLDFINATSNSRMYEDDSEDSDYSRESNSLGCKIQVEKKCALITGPPGVGKTSLVYTIANELKLHVVESNPSEKRDFKLFSSLKLANQKGKINPIAKLFQVAHQKQADHIGAKRKKRRKLSDNSNNIPVNGDCNNSEQQSVRKCMSLSGGTSIVLFDDIDVVFEEDGPFLKSLVEFIRESKRPVILTATQSIDFLKDTIIHYEHIHLPRPLLDDCTQLLRAVCKHEKFTKLTKAKTDCQSLAYRLNCDIRQCLNRIHFYSNEAGCYFDQDGLDETNYNIAPELARLYLGDSRDSIKDEILKESMETDEVNPLTVIDDDLTIDYYKDFDTNLSEAKTEILADPEIVQQDQILDQDLEKIISSNSAVSDCFTNASLIDLMNSRFNHVGKGHLLDSWLKGRPTPRESEFDHNHDLGEQIRLSIIELTRKLYTKELISQDELISRRQNHDLLQDKTSQMFSCMNIKIKGRIEPPDKEFYTDIAPMLGEAIIMEGARRMAGNQGMQQPQNNSQPLLSPLTATKSSRRSRRIPSYLESISIYLDPEDYTMVSESLLTADRL